MLSRTMNHRATSHRWLPHVKVQWFLKMKIELYDPAVSLLDAYVTELKTGIPAAFCVPVFMTVLF